MAFVTKDGRVVEAQPWGINRILGMFMGFFTTVALFFRSIVPPLDGTVLPKRSGSRKSPDFRPGSGPRNRQIRGMGDINRPSTSIPGGCKSCAM